MDKYDEKAREKIDFPSYALDAGDKRELWDEVAALGRQCAAEAYRDAAKEADDCNGESSEETPYAIAARIRAKAAALTKPEGE